MKTPILSMVKMPLKEDCGVKPCLRCEGYNQALHDLKSLNSARLIDEEKLADLLGECQYETYTDTARKIIEWLKGL